MPGILTIDGSLGDGGGQMLRSALTLALITGQPFRITNIRPKRRSPGFCASILPQFAQPWRWVARR